MTRQYAHRPVQQVAAFGLALVATVVILTGIGSLSTASAGGAMLAHAQTTAAHA